MSGSNPLRPLPLLLLLVGALGAVPLGGCATDPNERTPGPEVCEVLLLAHPARGSLPSLGRDIHIAPLGNERAEYFVSFVTGADVVGEPLMGATMRDPFSTWPPRIEDATERHPFAFTHTHARVTGTTGGSRPEPALLVDGTTLVRPDLPPVSLSTFGDGNAAWFASSIGTRTLIGSAHRMDDAAGAGFFSYLLTSFDGNVRLVEPMEPLCVALTPHLAVSELPPSAPRRGFLVAMSVPATSSEQCDVEAVPTVIALERYLVPPSASATLEHAGGVRVDAGGLLTGVQLVSSPTGAWLVFEAIRDGASQTIHAIPLDADGNPLAPPVAVGPAAGIEPVFPGGPIVRPRPFATSLIGDDLVVAAADEASTKRSIDVQLVRPDGTLGAHAILASPDDGALFFDVQLASDPERRGLVVSWSQGPLIGQSSGMARLDCLSAE